MQIVSNGKLIFFEFFPEIKMSAVTIETLAKTITFGKLYIIRQVKMGFHFYSEIILCNDLKDIEDRLFTEIFETYEESEHD